MSAAWRQAAGKGLCQRAGNAVASARTFGAKRSRGLPPDRWPCQPHGGSLRAKARANALVMPLPARAPSVRNVAGGFRPTAGHVSRMAAACGQKARTNALVMPLPARTFGAKRSRGLPPDRSVHSRMAGACGRRTLPGPWGYPHNPALACCSGP